MRPEGPSSRLAAGDVAPAVLAIGRPDFPNVLIDTLRRQAGVGHCMVFALSRGGEASCLLDAGNIPIGGDPLSQELVLVEKDARGVVRERPLFPVAFVPLTDAAPRDQLS